MTRQQTILAPSILAADFGDLRADVRRIPSAEWVHIDVMDGHFVPNLSFGRPVADSLLGLSEQHLDVHLMIEEPEKWVEDWARDYDSVTFHLEAVADVDAARDLAARIRAAGALAGVSVKPGTPVEPLLEHLADFDLILIMSVEPGFGGQSFMPEVLTKVRTLRSAIDDADIATLIEIDGGINASTAADSALAGVDVYVAGSSVFGAEDPDAAVGAIRDAARDAASTPR